MFLRLKAFYAFADANSGRLRLRLSEKVSRMVGLVRTQHTGFRGSKLEERTMVGVSMLDILKDVEV